MPINKLKFLSNIFFPFYAGKLNGPPIPFFEESEPDKMEQSPAGMQLIESYIFPRPNKKEKNLLQNEMAELVRYATELPQVNESHEFNDNNIFDAVMEQLYRVTALGLPGFDSQLANNSLAECSASLNSIGQSSKFLQRTV
jgi:cytochrome c peroxidase